MRLRHYFAAAAASLLLVAPAALAGDEITITDAYARAAGEMAMSGAAFFTIHNAGAEDDRLIGARSDAAKRVELHTHIADGDVMRMVEVEDGFVVPAEGLHRLARGGDHLMFMGLTDPWEQDAVIRVTLVFENAGEVDVDIPVDNLRAPEAMETMEHGGNGS